jgi:hypothetical protein
MIIKSYFALFLLQLRATLLHIHTCLTVSSIVEFGRYIPPKVQKELRLYRQNKLL